MADSIAKAIVSLVPKFEGNSLSAVEKKLEETGHSGGAKMVNGMSTAFKKIAGTAAVAAAGKAAADAFSDAFNGYSEFEQLAGGVQKIFGDDLYSQIVADAKGAYRNMNMSANEYLSTINDVGANFKSTMGEEKGYKTAQTGLQAIADYASGTGKNIDELKEKFTLITRATSSYQSIADQFSGILPATSDEFLRQAKEAGFLGEQYTKLTEVPIDEYQEAVAKMLERGTDALGLLGNTAAETEGTLSGSIAGMKSAWENFLVSLGDPDGNVDEAMEHLVDMVKASAKNFAKAAGRIVQTLANNMPKWMQQIGSYILKNSSKIGTAVGDILGKIVKWIVQNLPAIIAGATKMFGGLLTALVFVGAKVMTDLGKFLKDSASKVSGAVGQMLSAAKTWIGGVITGIKNRTSEVLNSITSIIKQAPGKVLAYLSNMLNAGKSLMTSVSNGIWSLASTVWSKVTSIITQLPGKVTAFAARMLNAGATIIRNLASGVWSIASTVWTRVTDIVKQLPGRVTAWAGSLLNSGSNIISNLARGIWSMASTVWSNMTGIISELPGRIAAWAGNMWSQGSNLVSNIAGGIWDTLGSVWNAASSAGSNVWEGFTNALGSVWWWGHDIVTGIADGIWNAIGYVRDAAAGIAGQIWEYLHFSEPEIGPLSNFHTYMPDMMKSMAKGIKGNMWRVENEVDALSGMVSGRLALAPQYEIGGTRSAADVVGAIDTLHNDLYAIIKDATPDGITGRQFGRLVHRYA